MVMHARKHPRLNDGYYDRHAYHDPKDDRFPARSNNSYDRKPPYDRRREEYPLGGDRQNSPTPRYNHKLPYIDRIRPEKDRYDKYSRDGDRHPRDDHRADSYEKRTGNSYTDSVRQTDRDYKRSLDTKDSVEDISNTQDKRRSIDRDMTRKPENKKDSGTVASSTDRESSSKSQTKDHRQEAQRTALRVCGDWSEHVSSSGKKYFYNCKTEVSQWVKPKDWKVSDQEKQEATKSGSAINSQGGQVAGRRNGSIAHTDTRSDSPHKDKNDKSSSSSYHDNPRLRGDPLSERQRHASNNQRETGNQHLTPSRIKSSGDHKNNRLSDNKHSSTTSTPRSSSMDTSSSPGTAHERVPSRQITNGNDGSGDDMDISPDGSPKPKATAAPRSRNNHTPALAKTNIATSNQQSNKNTAQTTAPDQSIMWGQALQTLQTLQEVLTRRSTVSQSDAAIAAMTESPRSIASQSPKSLHANVHNHVREKHTDTTISSERMDQSPAASEVSLGQHSAISSAATTESVSGPLHSSINLPASLINYYDPNLISHVTQWPAEQMELRAHMVNNEGVIIGGHHCAQVSTELKRDRSQVRIAEVQSTLVEHRIHFLKQQISELETQEKGAFSGGQT